MKKLLGICLIALPFVVVISFGVDALLFVLLTSFISIPFIIAGVILLED